MNKSFSPASGIAYIKKAFGISLALVAAASVFFVCMESSPAYAVNAQDSVVVTLTVTSGISITSPADNPLSTNLGVSQSVAVGTTTWNVKTNDGSGYTLGLAASTNPAMQFSPTVTVDDYSTTTMPSAWSVGANAAKFGFTVFGTDVTTGTWGTGSFCNGTATSTVSSTLNYYGFYTTATTVAARAATTTPTGIDTTVCYAVQQGSNFFIPAHIYTATIQATATAL